MQPCHIDSDVAIVGAGPAGLTAAIDLAERGYTVTIVDQHRRQRPQFAETLPRTAEQALRELDVWDEFLRTQPGSWTRHISAWGVSELQYLDLLYQSSGPGWFLNRKAFEAVLGARASSVGCSIHRNATISSCERENFGWRLRFALPRKQCCLQARLLIDAAGRASQTWQRPFPERTITDHMVAHAFVFPARASEQFTLVEAVPEGWFYSASAHKEFVVLFMTDPDLHQSLPILAADQLKEAPHTRKRLGQPLQNAARSLTFAAGSSVRTCVATDTWVAVGDARMTLDPLSSSGILSALRSARNAVQLIADLDSGIRDTVLGYREQTKENYAQYLRERQFYYSRERRWPDSRFWSRRTS